MITSLIEMLELPNFSHMTTLTMLFDSRDKILLLMSGIEIMTLELLFQNIFVLRRPRLAIFADIIKIVIICIKAIFKDSKNVRTIRSYVPKCNLYLYLMM